jgi:hypothetical protein
VHLQHWARQQHMRLELSIITRTLRSYLEKVARYHSRQLYRSVEDRPTLLSLHHVQTITHPTYPVVYRSMQGGPPRSLEAYTGPPATSVPSSPRADPSLDHSFSSPSSPSSLNPALAAKTSSAAAAIPPTLPPDFEEAVDSHYTYHSAATRIPHRIDASLSPSTSAAALAPEAWRISLSAKFLAREHSTFSLDDFPARFVPFFAYKDVAVYVSNSSVANLGGLWDRMYREWYPSRDKTVFDNGILRGCGSPFACATMRIDLGNAGSASDDAGDPTAATGSLLTSLVHWHLALLERIEALCPQFEALHEGGARTLVCPGLSPQQQDRYTTPKRVGYKPIIRSSFGECFLWVNDVWEEEGVRLVVRSEDMLPGMNSGEPDGLRRDVELEGKVRMVTGPARERVQAGEERDSRREVRVVPDNVVVLKGSLESAMRMVLARDEARNLATTEWNPVLEEWLGGIESARGHNQGPERMQPAVQFTQR